MISRSLFYTFMPLLFFVSLIFAFVSSFANLKLVIVVFLFFYVILIIKTIFYYGFFSLYALYLYAGIFFMYSRLIFDLVGYRSFLEILLPSRYVFSNLTGIVFLSVSFLSYYVIDIVYSLYHKKADIKNNLIRYPKLEKISSLLIFCETPAFIQKTLITMDYVKIHGYVSLYTGEIERNVVYPLWVKGCTTIVITAYLFFILSYPKEKYFVRTSAVYVFCMFFSAFGLGGRGRFIITTMSILYFYVHLYNKKINVKFIASVFIFIVGISAFVGTSRDNNKEKIVLTTLVSDFFYYQGTTIGLPLSVIELSDDFKYRHFPFIFSPIFEPVFRNIYPIDSPKDPNYEEKYNNMSAVVSNHYYDNAITDGSALGGSFLAEMYDCGKFLGVIFWSIALVFVFVFVERSLFKSNVNLFIIWLLVYNTVYLSRSIFFNFIAESIFVIYCVVMIFLLQFLCYPQKLGPRIFI